MSGTHVHETFKRGYGGVSLLDNRSFQEQVGAARKGWYYPKHRAEPDAFNIENDWQHAPESEYHGPDADYFDHISTDDAWPKLGWIDKEIAA
jgi:hypothetical protein